MLNAIVLINLAFISYTLGVWGEKVQGELKLWHLLTFWFGFVNDTIGTLSMEAMVIYNAGDEYNNLFQYLFLHMSFHSITGIFALTLMLVHALWATKVLLKKNIIMIKRFHHYSLFIWLIWLIPFITGAIAHLV